ncbi:MAG: hypothetical protein K2L53_02030, partial [Clostridia bacterium]|nr:hypothetical protein [Clostridia bacterium]
MLLNGYESRTDVAFNGNVLQQIYQKITGNTTATYANVNSAANSNRSTSGGAIHSGLTAAQIKNNNPSKKNIVITFGGKQWIITSLSTNSSGQPILTMMLRDSTETTQWNTWKSSNTLATYLDNVYSTSYIRANLLNGKTATGANVTVSSGESSTQSYSRTSSGAYQYDIFAHNSATGSVTKYLEKPANVPYQSTENNYDLTGANCAPNDALGKILPTTKWDTAVGIDVPQTKTHYADWGQDYIWLPSQTEVGWDSVGASQDTTRATDGIWQLDTRVRTTSSAFWLRSGALSQFIATRRIDVTGNILGVDVTTSNTNTIRPCIHLNLKLAEDASMKHLSDPTPTSTIYNGRNQGVGDVSSASWYDASVYGNSSAMRVEYIKVDGSSQTSLGSTPPKDAGSYKVKFVIQDTKKYAWTTGTSAEKEIDYTIIPKSLRVNWNPNVIPPTATPVTADLCSSDNNSSFINSLLKIKYSGNGVSDPYICPDKAGNYTAEVELTNGNYALDKSYSSSIQIFARLVSLPTFNPSSWHTYDSSQKSYLLNFDNSDIEVDVADRFKSDVTLTGTILSVTKAGTYALSLRLKDKDNTVWADDRTIADRELEFKIEQASLQVNVLSGSTIECVYKQKQTISVEMGDMPIGNDTISLNFIASLGGTDIPLKNDVIINADSNSTFDVELATDNLPITGEWELKIQLKDGVSTSNSNYKLLTADTKLNVTEVTNDGDLSWRLWTDGGSVTSIRIPIGTFSTTYTDTLIYDGKLRTFEAGTPRGYSVNTSYSKNDFVGGYKTEASRSGNDNIGISADTYTTYVAIIKDGETEPEIYSIAWTINKALFDLSSVTWKNNGKLQYTGDTVYAELENLPTGLTATCSNNEGLSVGEGGTASVRFTLTGDYAINYELPAQGGKGVNYTFSGSGDFE